MNLSAPTFPVFVVSIVLFALAILGGLGLLPMLGGYAFWLAIAAYAVLLVGNVAKGL